MSHFQDRIAIPYHRDFQSATIGFAINYFLYANSHFVDKI
jgi:hypothetical protein